MKKTDQYLLWCVIIIIIAIMMWTLSRFIASTQSPVPQQQHAEYPAESTDLETTSQDRTIPTITIRDFSMALQDKSTPATIYDIRPTTAYDDGHIPGSLTSETFDVAHTGRHIVLITENGEETEHTRALFRSIATNNTIALLEGGITAWRAAGKPIVSIAVQPDFLTSAKVQFIEPRDLYAMITQQPTPSAQNITIIDTRRSGNFANGHIAGAINIPLTELEFRYREIPHNTHIIIYGATDISSFQSGVVLYDVNILTAKTVRGGWEAWEKYGYPVAQE